METNSRMKSNENWHCSSFRLAAVHELELEEKHFHENDLLISKIVMVY